MNPWLIALFVIFGVVTLVVLGIWIIAAIVSNAEKREAAQLALLAPAALPPGPIQPPPDPAAVAAAQAAVAAAQAAQQPNYQQPAAQDAAPNPVVRPGRVRRFFTSRLLWIVGSITAVGIVAALVWTYVVPTNVSVTQWLGSLRPIPHPTDEWEDLTPAPQPAYWLTYSIPWMWVIVTLVVALAGPLLYLKRYLLTSIATLVAVGVGTYTLHPEYYAAVVHMLERFWYADRNDVRWLMGVGGHQVPPFLTALPLMGWACIVAIVTGLFTRFRRRWQWSTALIAAFIAGILTPILLSLELPSITWADAKDTLNVVADWIRTLPGWVQLSVFTAALLSFVAVVKKK